eukprot:4382848-Pyramimonas_sp.AAC.1
MAHVPSSVAVLVHDSLATSGGSTAVSSSKSAGRALRGAERALQRLADGALARWGELTRDDLLEGSRDGAFVPFAIGTPLSENNLADWQSIFGDSMAFTKKASP